MLGIDELPQCWNVLKGEMSLVGPRPYVPEEVSDFQQRIPFFRSRALVKPGITGWAQVNWGYGLSIDDEVEKLQYDLYYIGQQSLYMDLMILLRTLQVLASGRQFQTSAVQVALSGAARKT
jgi:lipopolysaccharide/colanic/teichoic acid biosynthesis glycosyltransferase